MGVFRYETHCHTSEVSRCGHVSGAEQARFYKAQGYDGIVITDHFLNGNTSVEPARQSWAETCALLMAGFEAARAEGARIGLKVWYGFEYGYDGTDLLVYGLGYDWLMAHPDVDRWNVHTFLDRARADGAYIVHAHPFRETPYTKVMRVFPRKTDAVEVINATNDPEHNAMAGLYASHYGLQVTAGSDNHFGSRVRRMAGVETAVACDSLQELVAAIREGDARPFEFAREV